MRRSGHSAPAQRPSRLIETGRLACVSAPARTPLGEPGVPGSALPIDILVRGRVLMRVMRPSRDLVTRRRAAVAAALVLLLAVAACATAAPQGQATAAFHRHHGMVYETPGPHIDTLAAAAPGTVGVGTGTAALASAHRGDRLASSGPGPAHF